MVALAQRPQPARRLDFHFPLWPKQNWAFESPATEILFGGAAGPGKSHLLRVAMINWCFEIPGLQCYLFRRLFDDLIKNHMEGEGGFIELLTPAVNAGLVTITQKRVAFWNGSRIFLNHLQYDKNLRKYQGTAFHVLAIDELTHFADHQYRYLRGRVRMTKEFAAKLPAKYRGQFPKILCGSNPGGEGHLFVKKTFVNLGPFEIYEQPPDEGGFLRQFIPALMKDNPSLDRVAYEKNLAGLGDPVLVRALRDGDWRIATGAMFAENWHDTLNGIPWHVHPGFRIPVGWPLWRGADDGYAGAHACYWFTEDPVKKTLYVIDELYKERMLPDEAARRIKERDMEIEMQDPRMPNHQIFNKERLRGFLDNSAFADDGQIDDQGQKIITRGEQMNRRGCRWEPVEKWPRSRVAGIQNFHRLLAPNPMAGPLLNREGKVITKADGTPFMEHDRPGIVFFKRCVHAIEEIPALPRSKKDPEDIDDAAPDDHSFDGVRYGIQYRRGKFKRVTVGGI